MLLGEWCRAQQVPGPPPQLAFIPLPHSSAGWRRLQSTQSTACTSPGPEAEKLWVYLLREAPLSAQLFCCQIQPGLVLCALRSPPGVTSCGTTWLPPRIGAPRAPAPGDAARASSEGSSNTEIHWGMGWQRCCSDTQVTVQKSKV